MPGKSKPLVKTSTPGIYRRGEDGPFVVAYRQGGKQRRESAPTLAAAKKLKARRTTEIESGAYVAPSRVTLGEFAEQWVRTYRGRNGDLRATTLADYERDLARYVVPKLGARSKLTALRPRHVDEFVAWLVDDAAQRQRWEDEQRDRARDGLAPVRCPVPLADATVSRIVAALKALLSTAVRQEVVARNVAAGVVLPKRDRKAAIEDDDDTEANVRALTREQVAAFLLVVRADWKPFFLLLASTGLRVSEALALERKHLRLDGGRPVVRVRQAWTPKGGLNAPKSRHGRREVPLPRDVVDVLRAHRAALPDPPAGLPALVFPNSVGKYRDTENLRRRVLTPAMEEAGCGWAGYHALRHTFASLHIERGTNIVQLSRLLGHHKPSFTLDVYGSLMDEGVGEPLDLAAELAPFTEVTRATPSPTYTDVFAAAGITPDSAL